MEELEAPSTSISSSTEQSVQNEENTDVLMKTDEQEDIPRIAVEGFDDEDEEAVVMTVEEAKDYILKKVLEYMKDTKVNPLLVVQNKILEYHKQIQQKNEEFNKLSKVFEVLYRDQVKFLRHIGVMPKADTKTVGVAVDLPWTSESIGGVDMKKETNAGLIPVKKEPPTKPARKGSTGPVECIDLSSDDETAPTVKREEPKGSGSNLTAAVSKSNKCRIISSPFRFSIEDSRTPEADRKTNSVLSKHPAPLPDPPLYIGNEVVPIKPKLKISVETKGIVLQWDMPFTQYLCSIKKYEIFGYQEKSEIPPSTSLWKKIGSVDSMKLPMSCTLTQFVEGYNYHFSIRAVAHPDISGPFSDPATVNFKSV